MAETDFFISYDGPALQDGRMAVEDLAPALIALAEIFREANVTINPDSTPIAVSIQATATGSFSVELVVAHQGIITQVVHFFSSDPATALLNLKEYILGATGGIFFLVKWLRRRRIVAEETIKPGTIRITTEEGDSIDFPAETVLLFKNLRIRRRVREVVEPLTQDGIDVLTFRTTRESEVSLEVTTAEVDDFIAPNAPEEALLDHTTTMAVAIAAPAFVDDNKWRLSDGERTFFAAIEDKSFLERVDDGEPFRKGDILECEMRIRQTRTDSGLHTEYSVRKVLQHIPRSRPVQISLLPPPENKG